MPILSLPYRASRRNQFGFGSVADPVGQSITDRWKSDLIAGWKAQWDQTAPIYGGRGLVESFSGDWESTLDELSRRHAFNHENGEVPDDVVSAWYSGWQASAAQDYLRSIPGFLQMGRWNFVFDIVRHEYLDHITTMKYAKIEADATTLMLQAERAAAKYNLNIYGAILSGYKNQLSADEREFLKYFFLDWRLLKTSADKTRAGTILQRIGFAHATPDEIQKQLHDVYIAAGGKEKDWAMVPSNANMIVSNGSSNPITAIDWNQVNSNQKVVVAAKDAGYVSPLNTMFLPAASTAAGVRYNPAPVAAATGINPVVAAGGILLLLKLFWR